MQLCYILMHESFLLNQILVSFNFLMFVVCGFRESMCVFVVFVVLSSLRDPIIVMIIMILLFGFCDPNIAMIFMIFLFGLTRCLKFSSKYSTLNIILIIYFILSLFYYYYYYFYFYFILLLLLQLLSFLFYYVSRNELTQSCLPKNTIENSKFLDQ